jgi:hypothetical protein
MKMRQIKCSFHNHAVLFYLGGSRQLGSYFNLGLTTHSHDVSQQDGTSCGGPLPAQVEVVTVAYPISVSDL